MSSNQTRNSNFCVFVILISQLPTGFLAGYGLTSINTSAPAVAVYIRESYLKRYGTNISDDLSNLILTLAQSLLIWGSLVGALLVKPCLLRFSRKTALLIAHVLNVFSAIVLGPVAGYGMLYELLIIGRFISGISRGLGFSIIMIYVAEITCRQRLGFFQSPLTVVIFVAAATGAALGHSKVLGTPELWVWLQCVTILPSLPYFVCYAWIPNTPVYLLKHSKREDALATMKKLRVGDRVEDELNLIESEVESDSKARPTSLKTILKTPHLRMQFFTSLAAATSPQLAGMQAVFLYSDDLLLKAGVEAQYVTFITIAMLLQCVVAFAIFVPAQRKFGTKRVFVSGLSIATIGLVLITLAIALQKTIPDMSYVALVCMCVLLFGIQLGPQLSMMSLPSELTTADTRPTTAFISGCTFWLLGSVVSLVFPYSVAAWGAYAYLPFAIICLALIPFSVVAIPETHKRSSARIQKSFQKKSSLPLSELFR